MRQLTYDQIQWINILAEYSLHISPRLAGIALGRQLHCKHHICKCVTQICATQDRGLGRFLVIVYAHVFAQERIDVCACVCMRACVHVCA